MTRGRLLTYGKAAIAAVVGNEDDAHHISAVLFQVLNDVGFTIPAGGVTYWNGEAMHTVSYQDLDQVPDETAATTKTVAANAATPRGCSRTPTTRPPSKGARPGRRRTSQCT